MDQVLTWMDHHPFVCFSAVASILMFIAGILLAPRLLAKLPVDYLEHQDEPMRLKERSAGSLSLWLVRNLLGAILLLAGVAMLALPGQGILAIIAGLFIMSFPGKMRMKRWLLTRKPVWKAVNAMRKRHGVEPLKPPEGSDLDQDAAPARTP